MKGQQPDSEPRFLTDRMLGTLTRYLRFMGYDTLSANDLQEGNHREDTILLGRAKQEQRILLTRDHELARRGSGSTVWIAKEEITEQVRQLIALGFIVPHLRMNRCSRCNQRLRRARPHEIESSPYAPDRRICSEYFWCSRCRKLYWMGSHGSNLTQRLQEILKSER